MESDFITIGDALDQAFNAIGANLSKATLKGLEDMLQEAINSGLTDPARGVIEDFIANQY